jgi:predicted secreted protein
MTAIVKLRGTQLLIKVGDGNSPETFAHPCLINTKRGLKFTSSSNKVITPDCDNPDDPAWNEVIKDALSAAIDGAGKLDNKVATIQFYDEFFRSADARNVRVCLGTKGYWEGPFQLTGWEITGERGNNAESSLSLESDGELGPFTPGIG